LREDELRLGDWFPGPRIFLAEGTSLRVEDTAANQDTFWALREILWNAVALEALEALTLVCGNESLV